MVYRIVALGKVNQFERAIKMKIPVQAAFILSVVVTMAIATCQKQIAAENRQQKEKPEHSTAIEQGKKPRLKKM